MPFFCEGIMQNSYEWSADKVIRLKACIFERSIENIMAKGVKSNLFAEELAWLYSDEEQPFSAVVCAKAAGLDLETIRFRLDLELTQEKRDRVRLIDNGRYNAINFEVRPKKCFASLLHVQSVA